MRNALSAVFRRHRQFLTGQSSEASFYCIDVKSWIGRGSASTRAFSQEQNFIGGFDDQKSPSSPIVSQGEHLLDHWTDEGPNLAVNQDHIRNLLKVDKYILWSSREIDDCQSPVMLLIYRPMHKYLTWLLTAPGHLIRSPTLPNRPAIAIMISMQRGWNEEIAMYWDLPDQNLQNTARVLNINQF